MRRLGFCAVGAALALGACKDKKITDPGGIPASIEVVTAAPATGAVNSVVAPAPSFVVKNQDGDPMIADVSVTVTAGGGTLTGQPTKSVVGATGIGTWTLGQVVGANTVTVTVNGLTPATFTVANTTPLAAKKIVEVNPVARTGLANTVLPGSIVFAVQDTFGNGVASHPVTFGISGGGGLLIGATSGTTNAGGAITAPGWQLGKSADGPNAQKLRASSGSLTIAEATATVQSSFNIEVRFFGATQMTSSQQQAFTRAAQRISGIIVGDLPNVNANVSASTMATCASGVGSLNEVVDDLVIYAEGKTIDGVGQVLGSARPCFVRSAGASCGAGCANIPVIGVMSFDIADIANLENLGALQDVITHEMLHVIGVGSLWSTFGLITGAGSGDPRYTGNNGIAGCQGVGGTTSCASTVPVHFLNGPGSADSHWRESTFGTELMTASIILNSSPNPFSSLTAGALTDFGYSVNAVASDEYSIAAGSIVAGGSSSSTPALVTSGRWEILDDGPLYGIDRASGMLRLLRPKK